MTVTNGDERGRFGGFMAVGLRGEGSARTLAGPDSTEDGGLVIVKPSGENIAQSRIRQSRRTSSGGSLHRDDNNPGSSSEIIRKLLISVECKRFISPGGVVSV